MATKRCFVCGLDKEISLFVERCGKYRQGKYRGVCKECKNKRQRDGYNKRKSIDPFTARYQRIKQETDLTPEFLKGIWSGKCSISGMSIKFYNGKEHMLNEDSAELDKFRPEMGYMKGNVSWVSRKYNCKKSNSNITELKDILNWMETFHPPKEAYTEIQQPKQIAWNKGLTYTNTDIIGEKNPRSKLTEKDVIEIKKSFTGKRGEYTAYAKKYNVSPAIIRKIINREVWKHIQ